MPTLHTSAQVAELLDCSVETVELITRQGHLPGVQYGRAWVYPEHALEAVLNQGALEAMQQRRAALAGPATQALQQLKPVQAREFGPLRVVPPSLPVQPS